MAVSKAVVSRVRVLSITHILVGALLIIFGIADGVTAVLGDDDMFIAGYVFCGVWIGTWVSVLCRNNFRFREAVNIFLVKIDVKRTVNHNKNRCPFFLPKSLWECVFEKRAGMQGTLIHANV